MGLVRTVGNGESTKIFGDPWVPGLENRRWRLEFMQQYFSADEITTRTMLPQNARRRDDRWTWSLTTHGGFSVKTAYHANHAATNTLDTDVDYSNVWRLIWKMNTLPSTKLFLWRAVKNILPTIEALCRCGMEINENCSLCNAEMEFVFHALIGCEQVRSFWASTGLPFILEGDDDVGFKDWLNSAITQWDSKSVDLFAMAAQKIWERRNKAWVEDTVSGLDGLWQ
ncbi:uncharacterized protein G2W53_041838 [Senna tora]|uniref:Reverse transcriptase zinc-binding domain-containing protein n=1 Tax=Senna tora TaxID=362788 RepID=A0A834SKL2_9FABA|nr:uncharacterized protein G2W53_041838 [Senna tora]